MAEALEAKIGATGIAETEIGIPAPSH